jgi:putative SOS response-associated peptidase YedK
MNGNGDRELAPARWEMPTTPQFVKGDVDYGFTNIRNVQWQRWLGLASNCAVPATGFSEYGPESRSCTEEKTTALACSE